MAIRVEHGPSLNLLGDLSFGAGMNRGQYSSAQDLANLYRQLQGLQLQRRGESRQEAQLQQQLKLKRQQEQRAQQDQLVQLLSLAAPAMGFAVGGPAGGLLASQLLGKSDFSVPEQMVPAPQYGQLTNFGQQFNNQRQGLLPSVQSFSSQVQRLPPPFPSANNQYQGLLPSYESRQIQRLPSVYGTGY